MINRIPILYAKTYLKISLVIGILAALLQQAAR